MLSSTLLGAFTTPVTYVLLVILLGTAIMQVRYLNNALQRFDSTQVIPIQFVSFTLCVIIGSAVLYRDFERTTAKQAVKFVGGCLLTFFGVFLITSGRPPADEDEDLLSDEEGVEETIGLAAQDSNEPQSPGQQRHRGTEAKNSRRSSRVSFMDAVNKPLTVLAEYNAPTTRTSTSKTPLLHSGEASESAPLLQTQSREPPPLHAVHPGVQHAISYESAVSVSSATPMNSEPSTHPGTPSARDIPAINIPGSPVAPRPGTSSATRQHSQHFTGPLFSPSPFHSTVSGLVPATLLMDGSPTTRRPTSRRHSRPSLRQSLYMSHTGLGEDVRGEERAEAIGAMSGMERSRTTDESQTHGGEAVDGSSNGVRSRARSLTHTMGELFGMRGRRETGIARNEGREGTGRNTSISTEAL